MLKQLTFAICAVIWSIQSAVAIDDTTVFGKRAEYVGSIELSPEGTIIIIVAYFDGKDFFDGVIRYEPSDPEYESVLLEVGGLKPGEIKKIGELPGSK